MHELTTRLHNSYIFQNSFVLSEIEIKLATHWNQINFLFHTTEVLCQTQSKFFPQERSMKDFIDMTAKLHELPVCYIAKKNLNIFLFIQLLKHFSTYLNTVLSSLKHILKWDDLSKKFWRDTHTKSSWCLLSIIITSCVGIILSTFTNYP